MSCADVMYQPYSPYFPYQRPNTSSASAAASCAGPSMPPLGMSVGDHLHHKKFSVPKMLEPLEQQQSTAANDYTSAVVGSRVSSECSSADAAGVKAEEEKAAAAGSGDGQSSGGGDAHYVSANCVIVTYYTGDIASVVDEHFSRALTQPSSYSASSDTNKLHLLKDVPPMSQRNFPASFWNCNYQPSAHTVAGLGAMAHPELSYGADPYHHTAGALHATIHQNDPWHYTLSAAAASHQASNPYSHRSAMHELHASYSTGANRFQPQYGSLLLQPAVRSPRISAAAAASCTASLEKSTDAWGTARYHEPLAHNLTHMDTNYGPSYGSMGAIADSTNSGYMYELYKLQAMHNPRSYR